MGISLTSTMVLFSSSERHAIRRILSCALLFFLIVNPSEAQQRTPVAKPPSVPLPPAGASLIGLEKGSVSISDVNGDGDKDILITGQDGEFNPDPHTKLYLGNSDGTFSEVDAGLTAVEFSSASIADVNGDGNEDLLIAGQTGNFSSEPTANLYLGNGDGTFSEADAGLTGVQYGSTSIADVNGDGNEDLLITGRDADINSTATLYLGNGDGTFSEAGAGLAGVEDGSTSIADVNGDGNQDLLITGSDVNEGNPTATLYLGNGNGTFSKAGADLLGVSASSTSIADVDGDGNQDLLITGRDENLDSTITLYFGNGEGTFTEATAGLIGVEEGSTSIADINGDGNKDLLITGDSNTGPTATLYLGNQDGTFSEAGAGLAGVLFSSASIADVDGNEKEDLLVIGQEENGDPATTLYLNQLVTSVSKTVSSDGAVDFGAAGIDIVLAGVEGSGTVGVKKFGDPPLDIEGISESNVSAYRYVVTAEGDLAFGTDTEVRLAVSSLGGISDAANVTLYKRPDVGSGSFTELPTTYNADSSDIVAMTGSFGEFVLASNTEPLPVELSQFNALVEEGEVLLSWQTASETNNSGFYVQRRTSSHKHWTSLAFVDGAGTTSTPQTYRYRDTGLPYEADSLIYRLKQVDAEGSTTLSKPVMVSRGTPEEAKLLGTYPNPARSQVTVRYAIPHQQIVTLSLFDPLGRQVTSLARGRDDAGRKQLQVDTSDLPSGIYFVRLRTGDVTKTQRLMVVR